MATVAIVCTSTPVDSCLIKGGTMRCYTTYPSPIGELVAIAEDDQLTGLFVRDHAPVNVEESVSAGDNALFATLGAQLERYWDREPVTFDVRLRPRGTTFQTRVWTALRDIPYGSTISYGELARRIGQPNAVRAVGRANGANPICIIVPCHRVIGGNGSLIGYAGGIERKRTLLALEGVLAGAEAQSGRRSRLVKV
jgi:methylated-DNA-[protein]-cysteine S-methyltransferase